MIAAHMAKQLVVSFALLATVGLGSTLGAGSASAVPIVIPYPPIPLIIPAVIVYPESPAPAPQVFAIPQAFTPPQANPAIPESFPVVPGSYPVQSRTGASDTPDRPGSPFDLAVGGLVLLAIASSGGAVVARARRSR